MGVEIVQEKVLLMKVPILVKEARARVLFLPARLGSDQPDKRLEQLAEEPQRKSSDSRKKHKS